MFTRGQEMGREMTNELNGKRRMCSIYERTKSEVSERSMKFRNANFKENSKKYDELRQSIQEYEQR